MSGLTQLTGPSPAQNPQALALPPPNHQMLSVPVIHPSSPYWVDSQQSSVRVPTGPAQQHFHYYAVQAPPQQQPVPVQPAAPASHTSVPPQSPASPTIVPPPSVAHNQQLSSVESHVPRPRKPYTTTKVREMWSPAEHDRMLEGLRLFKRDWAKVTRYVGTRSAAQVRSHAQKYFDRVARDKTDDYVPRARPKRKSATPYPRKIREDYVNQQAALHHIQTAAASHASPGSPPIPIQIPIQCIHPASAHAVQHAPGPRSHSIHPAQIPVHVASQSAMMQQMRSNSPYLTQPQQHPVAMQHGVPQAVYSPYLTMCPPVSLGQEGQQSTVSASPVPHPSPLSYMSGRTYAAHSPAPQQLSVQQPHVYSIFSPMTPGGYPGNMTQSPVVSHGQVSLMTGGRHVPPPSPYSPHIPVHSHPGGPMDNCPKCAALQRYGNVLEEIGAFRNPQESQPAHGSVQGSRKGSVAQSAVNATSAGPLSRFERHPERYSTARGAGAPDVKDRSNIHPARQSVDLPSSASGENSKEYGPGKDAAGHRAHRAKVMKARKARGKVYSSKNGTGKNSAEGQRSSESYNASVEKCSEDSVKIASGMVKPSRQRRDSKKDGACAGDAGFEVNTMKKPRTGSDTDTRPLKRARQNRRGNSLKKISVEDGVPGADEPSIVGNIASDNSSPTTRDMRARSIESMGEQNGSTGVETYSPSERKEIFDAVKSLQILAKTSSSDSGTSAGDQNA